MNQKSLMGDDIPTGGKRVVWNVLMAISAGLATCASAYSLWSKIRWYGVGVVVVFTTMVIIAHFARKQPASA